MSSSESEGDGEIERCSSLRSVPDSFDNVPESKDISFKMFGSDCSRKGTNVVFALKEGKTLPYWTTIITKKKRSK